MTGFLESAGIYAIILFGVLEAACIPISSEVTFLLGGALAGGALGAGHAHPSLLLVIIAGTLAELVGSYISYGVGRVGGRPLVRRYGRYVLVTESDVSRAERFLVGRGAWALPVARMIPFVRAFASIVSGLVDIPPIRFGILNLIGTLIYVIALSSVGYSLGHEWSKIDHSISDISYVVAAIVVVLIVGVVVYRLRAFRREAAATAGGAEGTGSQGGAGGEQSGGQGRGRHASSQRLGR